MHQTIYDELKSVASRQEMTTYSAIAPLAGLDMDNPADRDAMRQLRRHFDARASAGTSVADCHRRAQAGQHPWTRILRTGAAARSAGAGRRPASLLLS